jgi:hypothetical protein
VWNLDLSSEECEIRTFVSTNVEPGSKIPLVKSAVPVCGARVGQRERAGQDRAGQDRTGQGEGRAPHPVRTAHVA